MVNMPWVRPFQDLEMNTPMTVLVGVLSISVASLLWAAADLWVLQRGKKGPREWPILGATVELLRNYEQFNDWVVPYFLRDGLTFRCRLPHVTYTFTADPANVEHILKSNFANYPKGKLFHEAFEVFLGDGIFNTDGEIWRQQRKTASFEFASRVLRDFSTVVFRNYSLNLASILHQAATTQQSVDMQDLFMRFTLDTIFKIAFGYEIGTLKPGLPNVPFAKAFEISNEVTSMRFTNPFWKLQRALKIGPEAALIKSTKVVDEFTYNVIKKRKAETAAMSTTNGRLDSPNKGKRDLFTRFLILNEEGEEKFTDKNFRDTMLNFVIAGRDTTAVTLSWFVYLLTKHPHVAQKVYEELCNFEEDNAVTGDDNDGNDEPLSGQCLEDNIFNKKVKTFSNILNFDSLLKLHYLHACIMETLRLYPAVPMDPKCAAADDILPDGTLVKKGSMVMYVPYAMGRMPSLWGPNATEFKPERWLKNGAVQSESPFKFTAFQAGPRICLGKDSAMLQLRMALAILCRFFTFQMVPGFTVKYRQMATLLLANGLPVKFVQRVSDAPWIIALDTKASLDSEAEDCLPGADRQPILGGSWLGEVAKVLRMVDSRWMGLFQNLQLNTRMTLLVGVLSMSVAYLQRAAAICACCKRGKKSPREWPIGATVEVLRNYEQLNDWVVPCFLKTGSPAAVVCHM